MDEPALMTSNASFVLSAFLAGPLRNACAGVWRTRSAGLQVSARNEREAEGRGQGQ